MGTKGMVVGVGRVGRRGGGFGRAAAAAPAAAGVAASAKSVVLGRPAGRSRLCSSRSRRRHREGRGRLGEMLRRHGRQRRCQQGRRGQEQCPSPGGGEHSSRSSQQVGYSCRRFHRLPLLLLLLHQVANNQKGLAGAWQPEAGFEAEAVQPMRGATPWGEAGQSHGKLYLKRRRPPPPAVAIAVLKLALAGHLSSPLLDPAADARSGPAAAKSLSAMQKATAAAMIRSCEAVWG